MELISTYCKKATAAFLLLVISFVGNAGSHSSIATRRVFWNKFDVVINKDNTITLTWNVTEYNNKSFIVQHSLNGIDWEDIAFIQTKNKGESMTDYSYQYFNKLAGKQYYRLKDIDVDLGSTGFSPVKTLIIKNENKVAAIWPNPATSHVMISNDELNNFTTARVFDLAGKLMIERKLDADVTEIPVGELPAGTYIVRIDNNKNAYFSQKIVKQ